MWHPLCKCQLLHSVNTATNGLALWLTGRSFRTQPNYTRCAPACDGDEREKRHLWCSHPVPSVCQLSSPLNFLHQFCLTRVCLDTPCEITARTLRHRHPHHTTCKTNLSQSISQFSRKVCRSSHLFLLYLILIWLSLRGVTVTTWLLNGTAGEVWVKLI